MNTTKLIILSSSFFVLGGMQDQQFLILEGPYMGQTPPGLTAEIFAHGLISTRYHEHSAPNFSKDGTEMIYTLNTEDKHIIMSMNRVDGRWSVPEPVSFSGQYSDDGHVRSPDGNKLYFSSNRPMPPNPSHRKITGNPETEPLSNWVSIKQQDGQWGEPVPNSFTAATMTSSGVNYMYEPDETGDWDIYRSIPDDGYQNPVKLSKIINREKIIQTPFIAPDESYLIYASVDVPDMIGRQDLFISFRSTAGLWSTPKNMGEAVNKADSGSRFPRITPDGKYLFFLSDRNNNASEGEALTPAEERLKYLKPTQYEEGWDGDIYWVSTDIIETLRPKK